MKCKVHSAYKGVGKPRGSCMACWCVYVENHHLRYEEALTMADEDNLIDMMGCEVSLEQILDRLKLSE